MTKEALKERLCREIDGFADDAAAYARLVAETPELGYFEEKTSAKFADALTALGLSTQRGMVRTGVRADLTGCRKGPVVAIMGELDGVVCRDHVTADAETGASHSCGHNLQQTMVLATAAGLIRSQAMEHLSGTVALLGVPAEEFIEIDRRMELRAAGEIAYLGGKQEMVRRGLFDHIDVAMMVHSGANSPEPGFDVPRTSLGFRAFSVRYQGKAAHAAGAPHEGINALNAAVMGINAVNALRETFRDEDCVRVHFIITKGGDSVNSVPGDVRLEGYVRALTMDCIEHIFARVRQAFQSGADAIGATFHFSSMPGYMPLDCSQALNDLFAENAAELVGSDHVAVGTRFPASTDMGDVTHLLPAIHPSAGGTVGALHAAEFALSDFQAAVLTPAKAMAMTAIDLLWDNGQMAQSVMESFAPRYDKASYLDAMDRCFVQS